MIVTLVPTGKVVRMFPDATAAVLRIFALFLSVATSTVTAGSAVVAIDEAAEVLISAAETQPCAPSLSTTWSHEPLCAVMETAVPAGRVARIFVSPAVSRRREVVVRVPEVGVAACAEEANRIAPSKTNAAPNEM